MQQYKPYDLISTLPVDKNPPTIEEWDLATRIFKKNEGLSIRDGLIVAIIVFILSLPPFDTIIQKIHMFQSDYALLLLKSILAFVAFVTIKHFSI